MTVDVPDPPTEADLRDLAALTDDALSSARRAELEGRITSSQALRLELERQRRTVATLRALSAGVRAPARLRARIDTDCAFALFVLTGGGAPGARVRLGCARRAMTSSRVVTHARSSAERIVGAVERT